MPKFVLQQSGKENYTEACGLALIGQCIRHSGLSRELARMERSHTTYSLRDILVCYIGLLCLGRRTYHAISDMKEDAFFRKSLDIERTPSEETMRQRLGACCRAQSCLGQHYVVVV